MAAEIAIAAAGIVLSPFLQAFFERMAAPEFDGFFWGRKVSSKLLRKLEIALLSVNAVLEDAEGRQFMETSVKKWLDEVKDTVYEVEDILDEIATKELQRKLDSEFKSTIACKVRQSISASFFVNKIEGKIKDAVDRLKDLAKQIGVLGLRAGVGGQPLERLPTTSLVDVSSIFGRHGDKEAIINSLLSDDASGNEMGVIAIVGMGGIGKTTLAQLVYNDDRLKEHFDLKAWVCVSNPFNVLKVMQTILEEVGSSTNADNKNLNQVHIKLKEMLIGKKFLLVLDDVWDKNYAKWDFLSNAFKSGAQGSKVIVTTRDFEVARVMRAGATHLIMELSKEDCWSLFAKYAFHDGNFDAYPRLEAIGRQIVEKCKGLPLAIKAIGALLWSKLDVNEWDKVLRSELWDLSIEETGILPALGLSYKYLSSDLKRCFAYCSIFPKDYAFKKNKLVLLWMAEGFLPQPKNKTMEEVGDDYFLALVSRSLFQRSNHDEYIIHDLVSDLAKFIYKQFALSHEDDRSHEIGSKTRHFSYFYTKSHIEKFDALHKAKRLHTMVELNFFRDNWFYTSGTQFLLPIIRSLRVLILSHHQDITELPDSIGKLSYLRYLDVSYTWIKSLPDSICKLCNLQILNLSHCPFVAALPRDMYKLNNLQILNLSHCTVLAALPRDMHKLINLHHLDFTETKIMEIPINLGELKCLRTLTRFIVSKHSGSCIEELGKLTNLRGSLPILDLQNVESPTDAKNISLRDVKDLEELVLEWKVDTNASESHIIVLDSLQPHSNLKSLAINGYGGQSFPNWVGHASFSNITSLRLRNCNHCCSLPSLGQLPSLQDLSIVGLEGIVIVGPQFYGSESSSMKTFGALKVLRFENMLKWEEWFSFDTENGGGPFHQLEELYIKDCPKLTGGLPIHLPSLAKLAILKCPRLVAPLSRTPAICELELSYCNETLLKELPTGMQKLVIKGFNALPDKMHILLSSLVNLYIEDCPQVESFPEGGLASNLNIISISNCEKLFAGRRGWGLKDLPSVRRFKIRGKSEDVESFPEAGVLPTSLTYLRIEGFPNLKYLDKGLQHLTALEELKIRNCPKLACMPEDGLPASLSTLKILSCPLLKKEWRTKKGKEWGKIAHVPNKYIQRRRIE